MDIPDTTSRDAEDNTKGSVLRKISAFIYSLNGALTLCLAAASVYLAQQALHMQKETDKLGQKIVGMDSVLSKLSTQAYIANENYRYTELANCNKFLISLYNLANSLHYKNEAEKLNIAEQDAFIQKSKAIFEE